MNSFSGAVCIVSFLPGIFIEHQNPATDETNAAKDDKQLREVKPSDGKTSKISVT